MPDGAELEQKIIDAIYRGACNPTELDRAIELIGQYFDSSGVSLGEFDRVNPEAIHRRGRDHRRRIPA
jgi:hypothetical protein